MAAQKTCYIHIGSPKTGSSSLQEFMTQHEATLLAAGILYPKAGRLGVAHHQFFDDRANVLTELDETSASRAVISSEALYPGAEDQGLWADVRQAFEARGWRVECVVFLREQTQILHSFYAESVKHGGISGFREMLSETLDTRRVRHPDGSIFLLDYAEFMSRMSAEVNCTPLKYISSPWNGGVIDVFFRNVLNAATLMAYLREVGGGLAWSNNRMGVYMVEACRLLNDISQNVSPEVADRIKEPLIAFAQDKDGERPFYGLTRWEQTRFMEHWAESNERLAIKWGIDLCSREAAADQAWRPGDDGNADVEAASIAVTRLAAQLLARRPAET